MIFCLKLSKIAAKALKKVKGTAKTVLTDGLIYVINKLIRLYRRWMAREGLAWEDQVIYLVFSF